MPSSVWDAIHTTCDAIRALPDTDAPSALFTERDIDRGRYDATLPLRTKLSEVLEFLQRFESVDPDQFPTLPAIIAESLITQLSLIAGIAKSIPTKCRRWPEATGVIPRSFAYGEINARARTIDSAYGQIYVQLKALGVFETAVKQANDNSTETKNVDVKVDGVASGDAVASERVVFPLHGIRTRAHWQRAFADVAQRDGWICRLSKWNFGRMSLPSFLLPFGRSKKIKWFEKTYQEEINDRNLDLKADERPSVVAHSFGTYIVGWAMLKYEELKFNKVILCGSILPTAFPWHELLERGQVRCVRNEYGVQDIWVKLVRFFVPKTGPSGSVGFSCEHARLEQKQFRFQHSEYFREGHMRNFWMPFLNRRDPAIPEKQLAVEMPASQAPVALYGIAVVFVLLLFGAIFAVPLRGPITRSVAFVSDHFKSANPSASSAVTSAAVARLAELGWTVKPGENEILFEVADRALPPMKESAAQFARLIRPFTLHFRSVKGLDGLHYLAGIKNCSKIQINAGEFTDISELRELIHLTDLSITQVPLNGDGIVDASPLGSLTNLESLSLSDTRIRFADFLAPLKKLKELNLAQTLIADLSSISGNNTIVSLQIRGSRLTDLSPLADDQGLVELTIGNEQVPGLVSLAHLKNLKKLDLIDQRPVDLTPIGSLSNLESIFILGLPYFDVAPLGRLSKLQKLHLSGIGFDRGLSGVRNVEAIADLNHLKVLTLGYLDVSDLGFAENLRSLIEMNLIQLPILSLSSVRGVSSLRKISLVDMRVVDISPLLDLPQLSELHLIRVPARVDVITELKRRGVRVTP